MTDLDKRFLTNTDETGRFIVKSLVTGKKYYVEPIGNGHPADWGDINPATKKVEGDYGQKYTGCVSEKESLITPENGFKLIETLEAGMVAVFLLDEVLKYNPDFDYHINREWTTTLIKDFDGEVNYYVDSGDDARIIGVGNINFFTSQVGI